MIKSSEIPVDRLAEVPAMTAKLMRSIVNGLPTALGESENESALLLRITLLWVALNLLLSNAEMAEIDKLGCQIDGHLRKMQMSGK